jgi:hypothetical protein
MQTARALLLVMIALSAAGCAPRDPMERIVSVPSTGRLAAWRSHLASDSSAETVRRVEEALQEIRLSIAGERELKRQMGERVEGGTEAIDEAVRQRVNGRRLREVMQLGYELRVRRLKEELAGLEKAMSKNAQLVTRPGDLESQHHLEGLQQRQQVRVEKYREELAAAERELEPLLIKSGRRLIEPRSDTPDEMPLRVDRPAGVKKV